MGKIVVPEVEDIVRVSSREVAEMMDTEHKSILRKIDTINTRLKINSIYSNNRYWVESLYKNRGKDYREFLISKEGIKIIIDNSTKSPKLKRLIEFINRGKKEADIMLMNRCEHIFKELLKGVFSEKEIEIQYKVLGYRIDYFIPHLNLIIEYDEDHHKYDKLQDSKRMNEIINELYKDWKSSLEDSDVNLKRVKKEDVFKVVRVTQGQESYAINEILNYLWDNDLIYSTEIVS